MQPLKQWLGINTKTLIGAYVGDGEEVIAVVPEAHAAWPYLTIRVYLAAPDDTVRRVSVHHNGGISDLYTRFGRPAVMAEAVDMFRPWRPK